MSKSSFNTESAGRLALGDVVQRAGGLPIADQALQGFRELSGQVGRAGEKLVFLLGEERQRVVDVHSDATLGGRVHAGTVDGPACPDKRTAFVHDRLDGGLSVARRPAARFFAVGCPGRHGWRRFAR